ncbi:hypothetical protein FA95DRAFT_1319298 [Auriscalpium vulgare]|uniref:Uncharacterized protein n=1 Tax=Auriscalpium vulgare TaxID=40419 RepID=A0ACB8S8D9_9AGAM|nr:hypothetical protein FA95DRAFT_1319298 [Auriscalpium vulgare]
MHPVIPLPPISFLCCSTCAAMLDDVDAGVVLVEGTGHPARAIWPIIRSVSATLLTAGTAVLNTYPAPAAPRAMHPSSPDLRLAAADHAWLQPCSPRPSRTRAVSNSSGRGASRRAPCFSSSHAVHLSSLHPRNISAGCTASSYVASKPAPSSIANRTGSQQRQRFSSYVAVSPYHPSLTTSCPSICQCSGGGPRHNRRRRSAGTAPG